MLNKTISILKQFEKKEYIIDESNAKLITPIIECRPNNTNKDMSFVCEMYPALSHDEIERLSSDYEKCFPKELKNLYLLTNGIRLFDRYISVAGLIAPYFTRKTNGKIPTSIRNLDNNGNSARKKEFWNSNRLFFGWYQTDPQIYLYMECNDDSIIKPVYACYLGEETVLQSWNSFDDWFSSEYNKYQKKFIQKEFKVLDIANGMLKQIQFF